MIVPFHLCGVTVNVHMIWDDGAPPVAAKENI
jgi:hypothetical protein